MLFYRYIFYCIYHAIAGYFFKFFDKFFLGRAARCIAAPRLGKNVSYGGGQMVGDVKKTSVIPRPVRKLVVGIRLFSRQQYVSVQH